MQARHGDGSAGHTMMLRVNGVPVLAMGSNVVPLEELEGRNTIQAHLNMVESMAAARFTAVRVWGGGVYFPDLFYERLATRGVMVMHDLMYAGSHMPQVGWYAVVKKRVCV
jgi:beta-mannosidase